MLVLDNLFKSGADLGPGGAARAVCPILFWEVTLGHTWVGNFSPITRGAEKWECPGH